jgi:trimethylamine--corrinoid protein Co-methyltransferase
MNKPLRPTLEFFDDNMINNILERAFDLFERVGVQVEDAEALDILGQHGAEVNTKIQTARIKPGMIDQALKTVPKYIDFYDENGQKSFTIGGDNLAFVPGGSAPYILDIDHDKSRKAVTEDAVKFIRLVDCLKHVQFNHPALILSDVPGDLRDSYRFLLALLNTSKPISAGVGTIDSIRVVKEMLTIAAGSEEELMKKPRATVSCCPTSPLLWDEMPTRNLIDCARYKIPARIVPAPISGGTSPITLAGTVLQQVVENLCGIVIHQLVESGAPVYCGTGASVMDMRSGMSLFAAVESQMIKVAFAQVFHKLKIPTYAITAFSESKVVDAQAGLESERGILLGVLGCVNLIGGLGMLETGLCQSFEKLVIDNEICGMVLRMVKGIECSQEALADDLIGEVGHGGHFLAQAHTLKWLSKEHGFPSLIIDRDPREAFQEKGARDAYQKAKQVALKILSENEPHRIPGEKKRELVNIILSESKRHGIDNLPNYDC